jgi:hypothetical protein
MTTLPGGGRAERQKMYRICHARPRRRCPVTEVARLLREITPLRRIFELAFSRYPLKGLLRTLDPILIVRSVRREQPHYLVATIRDHVTDGTRGKVNRLAYAEPVFFQLVSPGHDETAPFGATPPPIAANIAQKFPILQKLVEFPEVRAVFDSASARPMNPVAYEGFFH